MNSPRNSATTAGFPWEGLCARPLFLEAFPPCLLDLPKRLIPLGPLHPAHEFGADTSDGCEAVISRLRPVLSIVSAFPSVHADYLCHFGISLGRALENGREFTQNVGEKIHGTAC